MAKEATTSFKIIDPDMFNNVLSKFSELRVKVLRKTKGVVQDMIHVGIVLIDRHFEEVEDILKEMKEKYGSKES